MWFTRENTTNVGGIDIEDVLLKALVEGETIDRDKAMTLPAVSGAVDFICNAIASLPVKLYKKNEENAFEILELDPRVKMLNGDTKDTLDGFQLKKAIVEDYLLSGNGYCFIHKSRNETKGLYYVKANEIQITQENNDPIFKDYKIMVNGKTYESYQFVKLLRSTKDGMRGIGITEEVGKLLETAYNTLLFQLKIMRNGGNKKGFLKSPRRLAKEELIELKNAWKRLYSNTDENVVVLNNGLEFQDAQNTAVESQLNESIGTLNQEINALFHISDDFDRTFKFAIFPIVKAFETALNRDLLLEKEKETYHFEFDVAELTKVNIKERYEAYKLAKDTGFMTLNEIRGLENLTQMEGLDIIDVGLGAVLYDISNKTFYTPNTKEKVEIDGGNITVETSGSENVGEQSNQEETNEQEKGDAESEVEN